MSALFESANSEGEIERTACPPRTIFIYLGILETGVLLDRQHPRTMLVMFVRSVVLSRGEVFCVAVMLIEGRTPIWWFEHWFCDIFTYTPSYLSFFFSYANYGDCHYF